MLGRFAPLGAGKDFGVRAVVRVEFEGDVCSFLREVASGRLSAYIRVDPTDEAIAVGH
jgi:hypothetical protein